MKRLIWAAAPMMLLVLAGAANARPSGTETITTTLLFPTFPSTAPYVETYGGTFTASGTVSDTDRPVTAQALFGAVPSPATGVLQTLRTLNGSKGTLMLRCTQRIFPPNQPPTDEVSNTGSCVVLDATGAYSGLRGSGRLTGTTFFDTTPVTVVDTLVL